MCMVHEGYQPKQSNHETIWINPPLPTANNNRDYDAAGGHQHDPNKNNKEGEI